MQSQLKSKEGFTLMEVMFTAVLIALAISGTMGMMDWITQATGYNHQVTEATTLAHDKLEELIGAGYDSVSSGSSQEGLYAMTWSVADGSAALTGSSTAKKLTATVAWGNGRGKTRQIQMISMVGQKKSGSTDLSGFRNYVVDYGTGGSNESGGETINTNLSSGVE